MTGSSTHTARLSIEVVGYQDVYNELLLDFLLKMTDPGQPETSCSPAEGPEFELVGIEISHDGDDGDGEEFKEVDYKTLELVLGVKLVSTLLTEACERAEE